MPAGSDQGDLTRLVLLGASNLTRGISTVIETARLTFGSPLEVFAALGHGRSYGMRSSILFGARALPGIVECELWDALRETSKGQNIQTSKEDSVLTFGRLDVSTFALIADIGNDIIYGAAPQQIVGWIEQCIDRLQTMNASIAMTALPIESIRAVRRRQYAIVKSMLYPTRQLSFADAISRAGQLHDLIVDLAQRRGVRLIPPRSHWYGFDPIHVRYRHWPSAWAEIIGACAVNRPPSSEGGGGVRCAQPSFSRWLRLRTATPRKWWLFGLQRGREQPAAILPDGTTISLY